MVEPMTPDQPDGAGSAETASTNADRPVVLRTRWQLDLYRRNAQDGAAHRRRLAARARRQGQAPYWEDVQRRDEAMANGDELSSADDPLSFLTVQSARWESWAELTQRTVDRALAQGATWTQIGEALGMTRQGAWKRWGPK